MKESETNEYGTFPITVNETYPEKTKKKSYKSKDLYYNIYNKIKLLLLFMTWYTLNVLYNVDNKKALNMLNLPWLISSIQLFVGWIFISIYWISGYKKIPKIYCHDIFFKNISIQSICHILVHFGAVISMSGTSVSFTHVIKACEPVFTAILSIFFLKQYLKVNKYLSLLIIVSGVICASVKELNFTWVSFLYATISSLGSSIRSLVIIFEGKSSYNFFFNYDSSQYNYTYREMMSKIVLSGVWYYLNNEFAFMCLEQINQVTHAVANSIKRVVIIVSSIIIFKTHVTLLGITGSAIAILGTFLYSIF